MLRLERFKFVLGSLKVLSGLLFLAFPKCYFAVFLK
jgi:hypothetical protein